MTTVSGPPEPTFARTAPQSPRAASQHEPIEEIEIEEIDIEPDGEQAQ
jgi:hypothetical protein